MSGIADIETHVNVQKKQRIIVLVRVRWVLMLKNERYIPMLAQDDLSVIFRSIL